MLKKQSLFVCTILLLSNTLLLSAQDTQVFRFDRNRNYLNPGLTGQQGGSLALLSNVRYASLPGSFVTHIISADYRLEEAKSGIGATVVLDKAGASGFTQQKVLLNYSYKIALDNNWELAPGLGAGFGLNKIDPFAAVFEDQLNDQQTQQGATEEVIQVARTNYFDASFGLAMYNKDVWMGFAINHINRPNIGFFEMNRQGMLYSLHGKYKKRLEDRRTALVFAGQLKYQTGYVQFDWGGDYEIDQWRLGIWGSGLPLLGKTTFVGGQHVGLNAGFALEHITISYIYGIPINSLIGVVGAAHEVGLVYDF